MKKIRKYIAIVLSSSILLSCGNAFDTHLSSSIELDKTIVDVNALQVAANGSYSRFASSNLYNRSLVLIPALLSDNAYMDPLDNRGRFLEYDNYNVTAFDSRADGTWDNLYRSVAQTSIIIREAAKLNVPESQKEDANHYKGEVHALRALAFLLLQQYYAQPYNYSADQSHLGVPIPDFSKIGLEIIYPSRSTTAEVYKQIVSDLKEAISLLKVKKTVYRIDKMAAKALLARVYLNMEKWDEAEKTATEVINEFGGGLIKGDNYVESWSADFSSESIFSFVNTPIDNSGVTTASFFFLKDRDAFATADFIKKFSATDVRLGLYPYKSSSKQNVVAKYPNYKLGTDNAPVIRLSEMYLIKAEAQARLKKTTEAQNTLNKIVQIRDAVASKITLTGQELIDRVLLERRKELAFEGFRIFDLTRTGTTFTKFRIGKGNLTIKAPTNFTILPIPVDEINANKGLQGQQNPGY